MVNIWAMDKNNIIGVGSSKDAGLTDKRQCVEFDVMYLYKTMLALKNFGIEKVYISVEKDKPIMIGGKDNGILLAPIID